MTTILELQKKYGNTPDFLLIAEFVLKKSRENLLTYPKQKISFLKKLKIIYFCKKRLRGVPLAYLTGHKEFFGLDFLVNKHVLIPRPETELLVENTIEEITSRGRRSATPTNTILIDVGTGSGCIPIAIAKHTPTSLRIFASDISRRALCVAKKNAKHRNANINFLHGNLLEPIIRHCRDVARYVSTPNDANIIITANLPYLTQKQFDEEKSIHHEPRLALIGDSKTGLLLYEELLKQIQTLLTINNNSKLSIFLEIDPAQSSLITPLIKKYLPTAQTQIKPDLAGRDRLVIIQIN